MLHHEGGQLAVQPAEKDEVSVAHFVEHGDEVTFAVGGAFGGLHRADIRDVAVVTNRIVVDKVAHILNQAVVAHRYVSKRGVVDA